LGLAQPSHAPAEPLAAAVDFDVRIAGIVGPHPDGYGRLNRRSHGRQQAKQQTKQQKFQAEQKVKEALAGKWAGAGWGR
jgi:hypothetical protein